MKKILYITLSIFVLASCGGEGKKIDDTTVEGKRALLKEKKTALKTLEGEIAELKADILKMDPPKEKPAQLVSIETLAPSTFERFVDLQAAVMSDNPVYASSETGGRLTSMTVREGQYVKQGQLIATVDLQTLKDQKAELETSLSLAKDVYNRQKRLWDQDLGTEIQYLQAKNSVERLEKTMVQLDNQLKKANVYAPISGVVDREFLQSGELAGPGTPIVQIFNPNKLIVTADVPETYLGKIKRGQRVKVNFPALGKEVTLPVSLVGRTIDPSNRTFKLELNTSSMGGVLKPNLLAELSFNDLKIKDALLVDLPLVQEEVSGKKYLYTAINDGGKLKAQKTYVETGESDKGKIVVTSGLTGGDMIITEGARSVINGDPIKNISK